MSRDTNLKKWRCLVYCNSKTRDQKGFRALSCFSAYIGSKSPSGSPDWVRNPLWWNGVLQKPQTPSAIALQSIHILGKTCLYSCETQAIWAKIRILKESWNFSWKQDFGFLTRNRSEISYYKSLIEWSTLRGRFEGTRAIFCPRDFPKICFCVEAVSGSFWDTWLIVECWNHSISIRTPWISFCAFRTTLARTKNEIPGRKLQSEVDLGQQDLMWILWLAVFHRNRKRLVWRSWFCSLSSIHVSFTSWYAQNISISKNP